MRLTSAKVRSFLYPTKFFLCLFGFFSGDACYLRDMQLVWCNFSICRYAKKL
nr:MAG TPA: hypothetical protein [Caudoviricetes sp.]